jgi:hypothetical protein
MEALGAARTCVPGAVLAAGAAARAADDPAVGALRQEVARKGWIVIAAYAKESVVMRHIFSSGRRKARPNQPGLTWPPVNIRV